MGVLYPQRLRVCRERLLLDEVSAGFRHELSGKLGALRIIAYTLKRDLKGGADAAARSAEALDLLETTARDALSFFERIPEAMHNDDRDPLELGEHVNALVRELGMEEQITVTQGEEGWVDAEACEVELAVVCLLENALAASESRAVVHCTAVGDDAVIVVEACANGPERWDPVTGAVLLASNEEGPLRWGLRIAERVARRWQGSLELGSSNGRAQARLRFPRIVPSGDTDG